MSGEPCRATTTAMPPLCLDVDQAAAAVGVSGSVVRGWIERGLLPIVRFPSTRRPGPSRRIVISVADPKEFVEQYRDTASAPNAALSQAAVRRWRQRAERAS